MFGLVCSLLSGPLETLSTVYLLLTTQQVAVTPTFVLKLRPQADPPSI